MPLKGDAAALKENSVYAKELRWALDHKDDPDAKTLISLASMYQRHQDRATLGLIQGAVDRVREKMKATV